MSTTRINWDTFKSITSLKKLNMQFIHQDGVYLIKAFDGQLEIDCVISESDANDSANLADFVNNYRDLSTTNTPPNSLVTTQYELNNKDLKLARAQGSISAVSGIDGVSGSCTMYIASPGTFGVDFSGRYVAGGYMLIDSYDLDDFVIIYVEDKNRLLAAVYGDQAELGRPMSDEEMQANSPYTSYPILKSYTDDEQPPEQEGWYFWPLATGNSPPFGECEVEPIGGYGFVPAGFYVKIIVNRKNLSTGNVRTMLYWGKYSPT